MKVTVINGREFVMYEQSDRQPCPMCYLNTVVPLTPKQLAEQPDDTTHVCHPALGGCNQGFSLN